MSLSLVILTHTGYGRYLAGVMAAVEAQRAAIDQIILVIDGEVPLAQLRLPTLTVRVIQEKFESPQHARNAGLAAVLSKWVCYLDGDNIPSQGYFAIMRATTLVAPETCAVCYPGTVMRVTEQTAAERIWQMPEWSRDKAVESSIADTSSAWRTAALRSVGGWFLRSGMLDDYSTACGLWRAGWTGQRVTGAVSVLRWHAQCRSRNLRSIPETLWYCRRHALVTLWAGRWDSADWLFAWYRDAELPPQTEIVWVDNSGNEAFNQKLYAEAKVLSAARFEIQSIRIERVREQLIDDSKAAIHEHVAHLYNVAFAATQAEVVITIEDDVIPPLRALRELLSPIQPWVTLAAVAGVYPSRDHAERATASGHPHAWRDMPTLASLDGKRFVPIGMVPGGFTVWNAAIIRQFMPFRASLPVLGWDGEMCSRLNGAGYRLWLAAHIRCEHLCGPPRQHDGGS